jgi:hypothetical protein
VSHGLFSRRITSSVRSIVSAAPYDIGRTCASARSVWVASEISFSTSASRSLVCSTSLFLSCSDLLLENWASYSARDRRLGRPQERPDHAEERVQ